MWKPFGCIPRPKRSADTARSWPMMLVSGCKDSVVSMPNASESYVRRSCSGVSSWIMIEVLLSAPSRLFCWRPWFHYKWENPIDDEAARESLLVGGFKMFICAYQAVGDESGAHHLILIQ